MMKSQYNKLFKIFCILTLIFLIFTPQINLIKDSKTRSIRISTEIQWNKTIANIGQDEGRDILIDNNGDIIITGSFYNSSKVADDIIIAKYNSNGALDWNKTWGGPSDDSGLSIAVDLSNNIYITGYTTSYGRGSYDICVIKYSASGNLIWNKTWGSNNADKGYGIEIDGSGYVYIGGVTKITDGYDDVVLLKYDMNTGLLIKNTTWGDYYDDRAHDIALDSAGNVYLTGYTDNYGAIVRDLFLIKYDTAGDIVYNKTFGDDRWYEGRSLIFDSSNSVYISGFIQNYGKGGDFFLCKFNSSTGNMDWSTIWGGDNDDFAYDIALDSKASLYIVGSSRSYEGDYKKICVVKFNNSGQFQWYKTFSNDIEDVGFGIIIDSIGNTYITGKTKLSENDFDIIIIKDRPIPWRFILYSDTTPLDIDGSFNLSWTEALEANNYTLYQSNDPIVEIDENVIEIVEGNINRTYLIKNLEEGIYYFKVFAFNNNGNKSSNQISIRVLYPPGSFELFKIIPEINTDGRINLSWSESLGAESYSIYFNENYIDNINSKGDLVVDDIFDRSYLLPEVLSDGTYYFVIVAMNDAGLEMSNCINVTINKVPCFFTLNKEIDNIDYDEDGNFFLTWTKSNFSQYYIIYIAKSNITNVNVGSVSIHDLYEPDFEWPEYRYPVSLSKSGIYFFKVIAYNDYGNFSTNCIQVEVILPVLPEGTPFLLIFIIIISISIPGIIIALYLYKKIIVPRKGEQEIDK